MEDLSYDSFGVGEGSQITRYDYTGRERESITGLMYYRARWYDPNIGRFISEDPIGFSGGDVNLYSYVWQNPLSFRDPSGLSGSAGALADLLEAEIESLREQLTAQNPHATNINTGINYLANNYKGSLDILRWGRDTAIGIGVIPALLDYRQFLFVLVRVISWIGFFFGVEAIHEITRRNANQVAGQIRVLTQAGERDHRCSGDRTRRKFVSVNGCMLLVSVYHPRARRFRNAEYHSSC